MASSEPSPVQRQRHHKRIAEALAGARAGQSRRRERGDRVAFRPGARGRTGAALLRAAARAATRVFAYDEVQALLRRALALLDRLPEASRPALELPLQTALSAAIQVTQGWASHALEPVNARVFELSRAVGDAEQRAVALLNALAFYAVRADLHRVQTLMAELPTAMEAIESPTLRAMAAAIEMGANLFMGHFAKAETVYLAAKGIYSPYTTGCTSSWRGPTTRCWGCRGRPTAFGAWESPRRRSSAPTNR